MINKGFRFKKLKKVPISQNVRERERERLRGGEEEKRFQIE